LQLVSYCHSYVEVALVVVVVVVGVVVVSSLVAKGLIATSLSFYLFPQLKTA
jgi:hypothetical protein